MSWNGEYMYNWEYSILKTYWSWENSRATTLCCMKNATLDLFLSSKHLQWGKKKNICIHLLDFSCFISWARLPPVEEAGVTTPQEEAWWLHWRTFGSFTPAAYCHQPFLGRQRLIRAAVARTIDLADVPTLTFPERSWDAFFHGFPLQGKAKSGKTSSYSSLLL